MTNEFFFFLLSFWVSLWTHGFLYINYQIEFLNFELISSIYKSKKKSRNFTWSIFLDSHGKPGIAAVGGQVRTLESSGGVRLSPEGVCSWFGDLCHQPELGSLPRPCICDPVFTLRHKYKAIKIKRGEGTGREWNGKKKGSVGTGSQVSSSQEPPCSFSATKSLFPESLSCRRSRCGRCPISVCSAFSTCRWRPNAAATVFLWPRLNSPRTPADSDAAHSISSSPGPSLETNVNDSK